MAPIAVGALRAWKIAAEEPFDSLPASAWKRARQNGLVMIHRPAPDHLSVQTQIASNDEPGDRLTVSGQVYAPNGRTPVSDAIVYAYNTDAAGYYGERHREYPPRLYGWMKTDANGHFELRTIFPGHYPGMHVPSHVHFVVWGGGFPLQWVEELRFEGDSYLTADLVADDAKRGEFRSIQPLRRGADGAQHCEYKIRLEDKCNFA